MDKNAVATVEFTQAQAAVAHGAGASPAVPIETGAEPPPPEPQFPGEKNTTASILLHAILRLEAIVDEEIAALQTRRRIDYDGFSRRKNRGLLELVRSAKTIPVSARDPQIAAGAARLRGKLDRNQALLRLHFDAVRSVADIICRTLREAESDGTYAATSRAGK